jgi:hypothetical protein
VEVPEPVAHAQDFLDQQVDSSSVVTVAGVETLAQQLLDWSPLEFDQVLLDDLSAAYGANLDSQVLAGSRHGIASAHFIRPSKPSDVAISR